MKKLIKLIFVLCCFGLLGIGAFLGLISYVASDLPQINSLTDYRPPMNSKILSRDGEVLLEIGQETRDVVQYKEIPKRVIDSFLAAEDDNFFNHKGVDYFGLFRAFLVNLKEGRVVQGGSTITQQVAKTLLLSKERTITRKIKDFLLAQKMEEKFSKEDILFLYLNQIYLGGGYYGIKSAFRGYFDKDLKQATIAESALVAGLLVAPGRYSPYINPKYAKMRQRYVLKRMLDTKKISEQEYEEAIEEKIKMKVREVSRLKGGHFTDWVRQIVSEQVGSEEFLTQGFEVVTTLDWNLQQKAEEAVRLHVKSLDHRQGFKGPIGSVGEDKITETLEEQRAKLYKAKSTYFVFEKTGENTFEYQFNKDEFEKIKSEVSEAEDKINTRFKGKLVIGNFKPDLLSAILQPSKTYQAIVLKTDDQMKVIFASIGGARVIIPESGFSWAKERKLDEVERYLPPVSKPSTILKPGDLILVKIKTLSDSLWMHVSVDFKKKIQDKELITLLQKQIFITADLDQEPEAEGALVSLNSQNGQILSMVGGVDFQRSQFNRALQAARQPGSSFKPFIYAAALENGYTPTSIILDTPQALGGVDNSLSWKPKNYDGQFLGPITFRKALEVSRNIPTIKILQDIGVSKIIDLAERFGLKAHLPRDMSISLGSFGIPLIELVKGYAIFSNGGKKVQAHAILSVKDYTGKKYNLATKLMEPEELQKSISSEVEETPPVPLEENPFLANLNDQQVYDPRLAFVMTNILKGVINSGTATAARSLGAPLAGKTGTTNNYVDALFVGYSSHVVTGAWVGLDNNKPLGYGETGGSTALPIWIDYMRSAIAKYGAGDFFLPEGISQVLINKDTGRETNSSDSNAFLESFVQGYEKSRFTIDVPGTEGDKPKTLEDDDYFSNQ